jgi:hypothetical protein
MVSSVAWRQHRDICILRCLKVNRKIVFWEAWKGNDKTVCWDSRRYWKFVSSHAWGKRCKILVEKLEQTSEGACSKILERKEFFKLKIKTSEYPSTLAPESDGPPDARCCYLKSISIFRPSRHISVSYLGGNRFESLPRLPPILTKISWSSLISPEEYHERIWKFVSMVH